MPFLLHYEGTESFQFNFCIDSSSVGNDIRFIRCSCTPNAKVSLVIVSVLYLMQNYLHWNYLCRYVFLLRGDPALCSKPAQEQRDHNLLELLEICYNVIIAIIIIIILLLTKLAAVAYFYCRFGVLCCLCHITGDLKETSYIFQHFAVTVQCFNAIASHDTSVTVDLEF